MNKLTVIIAGVALVASATVAQARDQIRVVGSSTVFPFSTTVAEEFGKSTSFQTPVIESTGSGGGFKLFCNGVGLEHPDMTNASRAIKQSEVELCASNGVTDITEVMIGFDGIVVANSKDSEFNLRITRRELYLALAKTVPDGVGGFKANPYTNWNDIAPDLPNVKIEVLGPPPTSGTRDAFVELVMEYGAKTFPELKELSKGEFKELSHSIREDGVYIEAGENDNLIVQKLQANPDAFGIFGFSFLDNNSDKIQGSPVGGVMPTFDNISSGAYPVSRSLFFYIKNAHIGVVPGVSEFVEEFVSESASGEDGYLTDKGLIPVLKGRDQMVRKVQ